MQQTNVTRQFHSGATGVDLNSDQGLTCVNKEQSQEETGTRKTRLKSGVTAQANKMAFREPWHALLSPKHDQGRISITITIPITSISSPYMKSPDNALSSDVFDIVGRHRKLCHIPSPRQTSKKEHASYSTVHGLYVNFTEANGPNRPPISI